MQDKRKMRLFLSLGGLFLVVVLGGLIYLGVQVIKATQTSNQGRENSTIQEQKLDSTQTSDAVEKILNSTETTTSATESTSMTTTSVSSEQLDSTQEVKKFLSVYYTWELEEKSVTDRAKLLKEQMTKDCYEAQTIESDSELLKELIQTYNKKKEINTSNSTQLVSSRYLSSQVYQDTTDKNVYNVKVKIEQKAPYQKSGTILSKELQLRYLDNKVTRLKEVTIR